MIVLINPKSPFRTKYSAIEPPVWCALLASYLRQIHMSVAIIDAEAMDLSDKEIITTLKSYDSPSPVVVVMGANPSASSTPKMGNTTKLIGEIKQSGMDVSIGGLHPAALREQTLKETGADFIFNIPEPLELVGLKGSWDLLPMDKYKAHNWHCLGRERGNYVALYTSYGCPFNCTYCNIHTLYGDKLIIRDLKHVVSEIDNLVENYGVKNLKFCDELFVLDWRRVHGLCSLLQTRDYDLNIWAYARVDTVNPYTLEAMKKAGINWLCYGFESANNRVLASINKKQNIENMRQAVKMTREAGINILGNFMFGLPEDSLESMQETLDLAKEFMCEYVNFYCATAYPGSQLYKDYPGTMKWEDYDQLSPNFRPMNTKYLSGEEVLAFRDMAFNNYFFDKTYQKMIEQKFGEESLKQIQEMLKWNPRKE